MGDENAGRALCLQLSAQQRHHAGGALRVEIAGRLVGQNEGRAMDERARDGDALQLPAGQFPRHAGAPRIHSDGIEHPGYARVRLVSSHADQCKRQRDVLRGRQVGQHVKCLEDEAHAFAAKLGQRVVVEVGEINAVDQDVAAVRPVETRDEVEQRRLADAGLAHDADELAARDVEGEAPQYRQTARTGEGLADGAKGEHGGRGRGRKTEQDVCAKSSASRRERARIATVPIRLARFARRASRPGPACRATHARRVRLRARRDR